MEIHAGVITISDKGSRGEREDRSGPEIIAILKDAGIDVVCIKIIPDEKDLIKETLIAFADKKNIPLILTTGGTGVSPRDVTPDATLEVIDKEVHGGGNAAGKRSHNTACNDLARRCRNQGQVSDRQSAGLSQGRPRKPRGDPACTPARR